MLRVFHTALSDPDAFIVTLELVPGKESTGRSVDTVMGIARDAFADGRVTAVSITDNPGGNPSLSPDVIGYEIFKVGMDVIVHHTCRDANRVGMESRALQLAMMGMKTILALTGDYTGQGFGGQGAPVFDLDSVNLLLMLRLLSDRLAASGDPDGFVTGCAVSPFKRTEAETFAQYAKLCRKIAAGAEFVITQLGYDARKFAELMGVMDRMGVAVPAFGSVYLLTPKAARIMNRGDVPGAVVTDDLLARVEREWRNPEDGRRAAVERAARLGAVLKGLGYRGMHLGGVHRQFAPVGQILDRMAEIEGDWRSFLPDLDFHKAGDFYVFGETVPPVARTSVAFPRAPRELTMAETVRYRLLRAFHDRFFTFDAPAAPLFRRLCGWIDAHPAARHLADGAELAVKRRLLDCQHCGDCGISHLAFLCPESQCPKHTRNGACGGSRDGRCEVDPERPCVWTRTYARLAAPGGAGIDRMHRGCIPPRMWELNRTSSWLNFHLRRDHQSASTTLARSCNAATCPSPSLIGENPPADDGPGPAR